MRLRVVWERRGARRNPDDANTRTRSGTLTRRHLYRCKRCKTSLQRSETVHWTSTTYFRDGRSSTVDQFLYDPHGGTERTRPGFPTCPTCKRSTDGGPVRGKLNDAIPCNKRCVMSTRPDCECSCAGAARRNPPRTARGFVSAAAVVAHLKRTGGLDRHTSADVRRHALWRLEGSLPLRILIEEPYYPERVADYSRRRSPAPAVVVVPPGLTRPGSRPRWWIVDGNHRIAAARARGEKTIAAWVPA